MKKTGLFFLGIILILVIITQCDMAIDYVEKYHQGRAAWEKGEYEQAETFLKEGASRTKNDKDLVDIYLRNLMLLCDTQIRLKKYDEALPTCHEGFSLANQLHRKTSEPYLEMAGLNGTLYIKGGQFKKAIEVLEEAEQFAHRHPGRLLIFYNDLGIAYAAESRLKESQESFEKALELSREVHGESHERTQAIKNNLADLKSGRLNR